MLKLPDIREQVAQRLRELFPKARAWEESFDATIGRQTASLLVKFRLGDHEHAIVLEVSTLGQPRQIRAAVTRLDELRREMPIGLPGCGSCLHRAGERPDLEVSRLRLHRSLGQLPSGPREHPHREGGQAEHPRLRPPAPLAVRPAGHARRPGAPVRGWAGRGAWASWPRPPRSASGTAHNVVKRLEELAWLERDTSDRIRLSKPADLLESWSDAYTYRENDIGSYAVPERITRKFLVEVAHAAEAEGRRYAFTMSAGLSLVAPHLRMAAAHVYLEGDPAPVAARLGLQARGRGGRDAAPPGAVRQWRVLRAARKGRSAGHVAASALRGPRSLRAPGSRPGAAPPSGSHGLLTEAQRGRREGGELIRGEEEGGQEEEEVG